MTKIYKILACLKGAETRHFKYLTFDLDLHKRNLSLMQNNDLISIIFAGSTEEDQDLKEYYNNTLFIDHKI